MSILCIHNYFNSIHFQQTKQTILNHLSLLLYVFNKNGIQDSSYSKYLLLQYKSKDSITYVEISHSRNKDA